jgi:threonine dehydratase
VAQLAGKPIPSQAEGIARTSLGAPILGQIAWDILEHRVAASTLVSEKAIADAQRWLWQEAKLVAEPGGATALAALMSGAWTPTSKATSNATSKAHAPVGIVICGANADALPG